jgi:hypothetical protein
MEQQVVELQQVLELQQINVMIILWNYLEIYQLDMFVEILEKMVLIHL